MRDINTLLNDFEDIKILCQFLYASKENSVKFKNAIDVPLELTMTDDFTLKVRNLNFEDDVPRTVKYGPYELSVIVGMLKDEKPELFVGDKESHGISSRWDEINVLVDSTVTLSELRNRPNSF